MGGIDETDRELVERFLRQHAELYGPEVFVPARAQAPAVPTADPLRAYYEEIRHCRKCPLAERRTHFVFGVGNPHARVMLIGEAPGADEDRLGEPFVGRAGQLLTRLLRESGFAREEVYIANILKCRPPENRDPLPTEIALCFPYLRKQIELIAPDFIVALGRIAAHTLLNTTTPLNKLRGVVHGCAGARLIVTYHPAAILRAPQFEEPARQDLRMLRMLYEQKYGSASSAKA
ncbi:MAG: uracil-DNA glycosylase [candidate division KSB1 bacterium]|nr:uracil-DNA glycosylase [candidate division KSB1 bacterium]MDZ7294166.1 uracil-DNA glycosylase [candidate division KSB1 bacterium]MDZ7377785.1 uracil-DNA glycosylase [candidate division KSB1 bacterium]MDZ7384995.1 uracil-DNA glycosylase [candidate division KSB1 bacterium]MDZ7391670.1 uracil-DNA glycosylase [candidate division KSB1 bacterium]